MLSTAIRPPPETVGNLLLWNPPSVKVESGFPASQTRILYKNEPEYLLMPLRFVFESIHEEVAHKGKSGNAIRTGRSFTQKHGKRRKEMRMTGRSVTGHFGLTERRAVNFSVPSLNANVGKLFVTSAAHEELKSDGETLLVDRGLAAPGTAPATGRCGIDAIDDLIFSAELLEPGWDCADAVAPNEEALRDAYFASYALSEETVEPEVEVDVEMGTLRLIWTSPNGRRSFALVFKGQGKVIGVFTCLDGTKHAPWSLPATNDVCLAIRLEDPLIENVLLGK
jgi:hypothetical protein